ncbi:hypothetical protein K6L44_17265, partial [Gluconacetobacter entanii]|uniref:hypothetical protein n=1 Tax=Gluconacetobacter entanii TaxID=108528 RepID=UPI001C93458C
CFIFHHPQSTPKKWNHTEQLRAKGFFEPSICPSTDPGISSPSVDGYVMYTGKNRSISMSLT